MAEEIKQYFTSYRSPQWTAPVETVPQEDTALDPVPQVQPDGWVINSTANVFIDEQGLHIYDGALYLIDISGESVLGPSGFSGAWSGFISAGGIYNSLFTSGTLGPLIVTEVGTGNTTADYEASLSAQLPYWIVTENDYSALSLVSDSAAPGTRAIEIDTSVLPNTEPTMTVLFYQDVAITPGNSYLVKIMLKRVGDGNGRMRIEASWRDEDHAIIGSPTGFGYGWYVGVGLSTTIYEPYLFQVRTDSGDELDAAPSNASYLRLKIGMGGDVTNTGAIRVGAVSLHDESPVMGRAVFHNRTSWDDSIEPVELYNESGALMMRGSGHAEAGLGFSSGINGGIIVFGDGVNPTDVRLSRGGANQLVLATGDRLDNDAVGYIVRKTSAQSVPNATWFQPTSYTNSDFIGLGVSWNAGGSGGLTADVPGVYLVQFSGQFAANATGQRVLGMGINGANPQQWHHASYPVNSASHPTYMNASWLVNLSAGDIVRLLVYQNSGGALNGDEFILSMVRIGTDG